MITVNYYSMSYSYDGKDDEIIVNGKRLSKDEKDKFLKEATKKVKRREEILKEIKKLRDEYYDLWEPLPLLLA